MSVNPLIPCGFWDNRSGPRGATNTAEGLTHSSDLTREGLGMKPTRVCSIEGCNRPHKGHGWCKAHLDRWRKTGDLGPAVIATRMPSGRPCSVADCSAPVGPDGGLGMCCKHYQRLRKHGDPHVTKTGGCSLPGETNPRWSGDEATYSGAHLRLARTRGRAAEHPCVDCGNRAAHWSYNNADPDERVDALGRYSPNPDSYDPRCVPCHSAFDAAARALSGERP